MKKLTAKIILIGIRIYPNLYRVKQVLVLLFISIIFGTSCDEKISYNTSMSIKNDLEDTISVVLYPKETPFEYETSFVINPNSDESFYWISETGIDVADLLGSKFDSILITIAQKDVNIKFTSDTVQMYSFNPFHDTSIWESEVINADEPDLFSRNSTETEKFYFSLKEEYIEE